ncbi:MAG: helix-turn-helix domain-containing protein [Planctomycetes bacterium]|nr:helix-turn-helix domain-containing protein [Planctomycetota bacterium]
MLAAAAVSHTAKQSYSTHEVARILGRRPFTVREWCRLGRVNARLALSGRGVDKEWRITHEELERIQNEGLLPLPQRY